MNMQKKGDCEHCGRIYRYSLWHSGFGDNSYAYCDQCGALALLNYSNPEVAMLPKLSSQFQEIDESWEAYLRPCPCGGRFRKGSSPRCPFCNEPLSATHAAEHIEAQSYGAASKGWRWQNNWRDVYCMAMDDPQNPGSTVQINDPVMRPQSTKTKNRWSALFSLGR